MKSGYYIKFLGVALLGCLLGCAMFGSWRAIPPPGGCDQCHQQPIAADWNLVYTAAMLPTADGSNPWQHPHADLPAAVSPMEERKVTEERCFRCHKGPDQAHIEYQGRYHH